MTATTSVLLVEDDDAYADYVAETFAEAPEPVQLERVVRLKDALARLQLGHVDVVLLDLSLPDAHELHAVRAVHAQAPFVPLIVLTGSVDDRLGARALADGAHDYLLKGEVDAAILGRAIRSARERLRYLDGVRARDEDAKRAVKDEVGRRAVFLAKVGQLLIGSLDVDATLAAVVVAALPELADWSVAQVKDDDADVVRQVTSAELFHSTRPGHAVAPLGSDDDARQAGLDFATVLRTGARGIYSPGPGAPAQAALIVPITLRGRIIGAIQLGRAGAAYTEDDLNLAEELARRAALALENARLYRAAQAAIALRDDFLSIASHELRTPLSTLQFKLLKAQRLLATGSREPGALEGQLAAALAQTGRLGRLIGALVDVSRIRSRQVVLDLERCDLVELVREAVERHRDSAPAKAGPLSLRCEGDVVGTWDRARLEQVVANLLENAAKYGRGNPVEVTVGLAGEWAVLRVTDKGIGIAPEHVARIFYRFERAVTEQQFSSLGLGLYIARQIVDTHAGHIDVESVLGEGSTFTVKLPRAAAVSP